MSLLTLTLDKVILGSLQKVVLHLDALALLVRALPDDALLEALPEDRHDLRINKSVKRDDPI